MRAKLANPERRVVTLVGDGAFLMTDLELVTASMLRLGIDCFVFSDGELSQIAQGQEAPYNRKPCTVLGNIRLAGIADADRRAFIAIENNEQIARGLRDALAAVAKDEPVIVDVNIDYSKRTRFTKGVMTTVLKRFPWRGRMRFIGRALLLSGTDAEIPPVTCRDT